MEVDLEDVREQYWDRYLLHCRAEELTPSYKDFLVWWEEQPENG